MGRSYISSEVQFEDGRWYAEKAFGMIGYADKDSAKKRRGMWECIWGYAGAVKGI